jgi:MFS family permease
LSAQGGIRWPGALRHRNFRLFWFGQLVSLIGTWMQTIAQAWLVLLLTHGDPFWLGVVSAVQFLPVAILGLFGGIIADVLPKRRTLVATQTIQMFLAFALAALSYAQVVQVWQILLLAGVLGVVNAVDMPTRQAFVIEMVGREDVTNAVGLNSAIFNVARIVGPAVGGILIGVLGVTACFFLNGLSFLAVILGLMLIRLEDLLPIERLARPGSVSDVVENLSDGLRYVRDTPIVLLSIVVVGVVSTFGMNFNVLTPPYANSILEVGATGLGFLLAASGVGSVIAALAVASRPRPHVAIIIVGALTLGALELVLAATASYAVALLAMFGAGAGSIGMMVTANTSIQLAVPDALRGRVMSVYTTVFAGSTPFGGLLVGWVASRYGIPAGWALGGIASIAAALGGAVWVVRAGMGLPLVRPRAGAGSRPGMAGDTRVDVPATPIVGRVSGEGPPSGSAGS